jgi:hypothetical protein
MAATSATGRHGQDAARIKTDRPWTRLTTRPGQPLNAAYRNGVDLLRVLGVGDDHRVHLAGPGTVHGRCPGEGDGGSRRGFDRRWFLWAGEQVAAARSLADVVLDEWAKTTPVPHLIWDPVTLCGAPWSVMATRAEEVALAAHLRRLGRLELLHCDVCSLIRPVS